jgi:hypothetical protein
LIMPRLLMKGVGTERIRGSSVRLRSGIGQHDYRDVLVSKFRADFLNYGETIHARHVQIEKNQVGRTVLRPVRIGFFVDEVIECGNATICFKQIHGEATLRQGGTEKGTIILIVIHKYDLELPAVHITHFCITTADKMITRVLLGEHLGPDQE